MAIAFSFFFTSFAVEYFEKTKANMRNKRILTPPPTPPLQGRGVPCGLPAAYKAVATPLPCMGGAGVGSEIIQTQAITAIWSQMVPNGPE